jgi:hypothetical protein
VESNHVSDRCIHRYCRKQSIVVVEKCDIDVWYNVEAGVDEIRLVAARNVLGSTTALVDGIGCERCANLRHWLVLCLRYKHCRWSHCWRTLSIELLCCLASYNGLFWCNYYNNFCQNGIRRLNCGEQVNPMEFYNKRKEWHYTFFWKCNTMDQRFVFTRIHKKKKIIENEINTFLRAGFVSMDVLAVDGL